MLHYVTLLILPNMVTFIVSNVNKVEIYFGLQH